MDVDPLGAYGAILATIVALVQIYEHFAKKRILKIIQYDEYADPSKYASLIITNISSYQVNFEFIGIGSAIRRWITPWKITLQDATSCRLFYLGDTGGVFVDSIEPYKVVYVQEKNTQSRKVAITLKGVLYPVCLVIDHSSSERSQIFPLK